MFRPKHQFYSVYHARGLCPEVSVCVLSKLNMFNFQGTCPLGLGYSNGLIMTSRSKQLVEAMCFLCGGYNNPVIMYSKYLLYNFGKDMAAYQRYGFYNNLSDIYISLTELYAILKDYKSAEEAGSNSLNYSELLDNNF